MGGWADGWGGLMDGSVMGRWVDGSVIGRVGGRVYRWVGVRVDRWVGWVDVCDVLL